MQKQTEIQAIQEELAQAADPQRAKTSANYFKTGPGQYGEGDIFLGVTVPEQRRIAHRHLDISLNQLQELLRSPVHEHRFTALEILVAQFERSPEMRERIVAFYLKNTKWVNNWDLVDASAPYIIGEYLFDKTRDLLYLLAGSSDLWERRIGVVATWTLIRQGDLDDALAIARMLLGDSHDLIQKAVGWMLREVGKKSEKAFLSFIRKNYTAMSRTTLRYAIERFPAEVRKQLLQGNFRRE